MAHTHRGQTRITLQFTVSDDLTNAVQARVHFRKPDETEGYFVGTITDPANGVVDYPVVSSGDLDDSGYWQFWIEALFNDSTTAIYDPVTIYIYEPGEKYIHFPYGTTSEGEGEISMPTEAFRIIYDNSVSGLTADDVQAAIDEVNNKIVILTAGSVAYVNTTSGLTATQVQAAIDELHANFVAEKAYTVGTLAEDYDSIQDAIDAAVTDGHDVTDQAVVVIRPGEYAETSNELVLAPGVHLRAAVSNEDPTVSFTGKVAVEFSTANDFTSLNGIAFSSQALGNALEFTGTVAQKLYLEKCKLIAVGSGLSAINMSNTGGSEIVARGTSLISLSGASETTLVASAGTFSAKGSYILGADSLVGSMQLSGDAKVALQYSGTTGPAYSIDTSWIEAFVTSMAASGTEVLTNNGTGTSTFFAVQFDCDQSPVIAGTGSVAGSLVTYKNGSTGRGLGANATIIEIDGFSSFRTGTADPTHTPYRAGEPYFRTDTNELFVYNGTTWVKVALAP